MRIELKQVLFPQPKSKIKAGDGKAEGKYKFFTSSPIQSKFVDEANYDKPSLIFGTGGNASVHFCNEPFSTSTDCLVMYGRSKTELETIYNYLKSNIGILENGFKGAGLKHISKDYILAIEIDLPREEIQLDFLQKNRIIDGLIEAKQAQLHLSEELVKSRFIEMFGDVINNDRNWPMATMGDVAEIKIGPFGTLLHKEDYIVGGHALVNPSHIVDGKISVDISLTISDEKYEELSAYHLKIDDIVLGRRGEMGRCAVVKEEGLLCGTGSLIIRPNDRLKPYFLQTIISNPTYKKIIEDKAVGVTMMNLNVPIVESLRVPMLPIALQNDFISFVEQINKSKYIEKISVRVLTIFWQKVYIWK